MSMSAKELHDEWERAVASGDYPPQNLEIDAVILRALSLLAAVEDGDEIVQRLNQMIEPGKPGFIRSNLERREAAARIVSDAQEIAALKGEIEAANLCATVAEKEVIRVKAALAARDAELASVKAERDALKRVHDDIMQAVDECGSYKP